MRLVTRKGLLTAAAAGGVLAVTSGTAFADAGAEGAALGSPGVLSGNNVQAPLHVPLNLCGNTVNVVGVLNPAQGNQCANVDDGRPGHGARAEGTAADSPGILSGNNVQAPVEVPVNACGNSVDVVGVGNPAQGNRCGNVAPGAEEEPPGEPKESTPKEQDDPAATPSDPERPQTTASQEESRLAETGSDATLLTAVPVSAALLLGGAMLYRRSKAAGRR